MRECKVLRLVVLTMLVMVSANGCRSTKPKPASYPPVGLQPTPATSLEPGSNYALPAADQWVCPMHPNFKLPQPGKCSICGMDLVHSSELSGAQESSSGSGHSHSQGYPSKGSGHGCCG